MPICIDPKLIPKVKEIVSNPSSISRSKQLTELFGNEATAKEINTLYEKSLLLSNQKTAIDKFISNFTEIGQDAKQKLRDNIKKRLENRTEKIQSDELLSIAQDIWNRKYKMDIPLEDVQKINSIKIEIDALKSKMVGTIDGSSEKMAYGRKVVELSDLVNDLKNPGEKFGFIGSAKKIASETAARFSREQGIIGNLGEAGKLLTEVTTSAVYKSVQASMDMSYALKQGFKVLTSNPTVWKDNFVKAFQPFTKLGSKEAQQAVANEWKASLVSRDMYQQAIDSKLAIGVIEDFFPTTLAEKIPGIGNLFKASNEAFTIFSQGSRMGLFEDLMKSTVEKGVTMTPELSKDIAKLANSITGRGSLGKAEPVSEYVNKIFFSGRYIKSTIDTFRMPFDTKLDPIVRKEAGKVALKNLGTIGTLMATASLFTDVETDPRSSKFGKMKLPGSKDTWIDLTAGQGSYITAASRIISQESKSSTTGKITKLNSGKFGARTGWDVLVDFGSNKLAPAPSALVQFLKGKDFSGKKPTLGSVAKNLSTPISAGNFYDLTQDEELGTALLGTVFDVVGASATDYTKFKRTGK